ncbi:MAG: ATP-binding protein [Spirochaetota bacterium]
MTNILIVEDEMLIAHEIRNALNKYGYAVSGIVESGEKAVEAALSGKPDCILMDITLAGEMDGIEAAQQIQLSADIPFIFLTSSADLETLDRAKKIEPYGYINKPVSDNEIFSNLETALYKFNAEQNMKRSQRWLSAMLNSIGEGIISVDIDGMITYVNGIAERMTGYSQTEALGMHKNNIILLTPSYETSSLPVSSASRDTNFVFLQDYRIRSKNREETPVDINCAPVFDENDELTGNIYSIRNIAERKKREETTQRAAEEWRVTFDSISDSIFLVNFEGEVIRCNKAAAGVLQKEYDDIIGINLNNLFGPIGSYMYKCFGDIKESLQTRVFEQRIGSRWFSGKFDPIRSEEHGFNGAVIILSDITDKKQSQEELEKYKNHLEELVEYRTQELRNTNRDLQNEISLRWLIAEQMVQMKEYAETASRSKSEFLANMSHELRTPLNSIIGFAKLIKMGIETDDSDTYLTNIINSGEHLLHMINDILSLSKMEAGQLMIERDRIDIMTIAGVSVDIIGVQAENKNIRISIHRRFDEDTLYVYADRKRIQQVFLNLLSNAVKFTEPNGSVTVTIRKNNKTCFVDITDTGIGIEREKQKSIFDKFSQVDNSLNKKAEGTGLGLAISKSLVESHNGHIYVSSEPGKGSTFTFTLPLYNEGKHGGIVHEQDQYPAGMRDKKILLIVTGELQIANAVHFFTDHDQNYTIVKRSDITSDSLRHEDLGAVIVETDENLNHEKKFVETLRMMCNVPIVALSRGNNFQDRNEFLSMGYSLFYMVPVDFLDIIIDLNKLMNNEKQ